MENTTINNKIAFITMEGVFGDGENIDTMDYTDSVGGDRCNYFS